jgi:hypothetical protein
VVKPTRLEETRSGANSATTNPTWNRPREDPGHPLQKPGKLPSGLGRTQHISSNYRPYYPASLLGKNILRCLTDDPEQICRLGSSNVAYLKFVVSVVLESWSAYGFHQIFIHPGSFNETFVIFRLRLFYFCDVNPALRSFIWRQVMQESLKSNPTSFFTNFRFVISFECLATRLLSTGLENYLSWFELRNITFPRVFVWPRFSSRPRSSNVF